MKRTWIKNEASNFLWCERSSTNENVTFVCIYRKNFNRGKYRNLVYRYRKRGLTFTAWVLRWSVCPSLCQRAYARNIRLRFLHRQYINPFIFQFVSQHSLRSTLTLRLFQQRGWLLKKTSLINRFYIQT